jgi:hypothetical protein
MMDLPCPNCGKILSIQATANALACPDCKEKLVWSTEGKKLLLSNPLPTYIDAGKEAAEIAAMWERADQSEGMIDLRKRQATVEMAAKWVGERIALEERYFKIGGGLGFICLLCLAVACIRVLMVGTVQLDAFFLFIIASLLSPFGFFFLIWSAVDRFTMAKFIKRIQAERRGLLEEEQTRKS